MKETLSSIAERTGYSVTTVSRVLNGLALKYRISEKAQELIIREAHSCNYSPNVIARNLRTNRSNTIGLILPSVANPYFADLSSAVISEANQHGYTTIVTDSMENEDNQRANVAMLISRRVDGIIASPCGNDPQLFEEIYKSDIPIILVDRFFKGSYLPYVTTNNYSGGLQATNYLIRNGHTNIACIQGINASVPNNRRVDGYLDALRNIGCEDKAIVTGTEFSLLNGYRETKALLKMSPRPTAILALSNTIGLGVIKAIREEGLRIPEDISLVSYDNNIYMDYLVPSITRVSQPVEEMARHAARLLFESIEKKKVLNTQTEFAPDLIVRDSVRNMYP